MELKTYHISDLNTLENLTENTKILAEDPTEEKNYNIDLKQISSFLQNQQIDYVIETGQKGHTYQYVLPEHIDNTVITNYNHEISTSLTETKKPLFYRKWNSGIAECWGILQYPAIGKLTNVAGGEIFYESDVMGESSLRYNYFKTCSLNQKIQITDVYEETLRYERPFIFPPNLFIDIPVININFLYNNSPFGLAEDSTSNDYQYGPRIYSSEYSITNVNKDYFEGYFYTENLVNRQHLIQLPPIHVHAIGRWK